MSILDANMQWNAHRGAAQKLRQRSQYIRHLIRSKDPGIVKVREWLRAQSEDDDEFQAFLAATWHSAQEEGISWVEAVTEMANDAR